MRAAYPTGRTVTMDFIVIGSARGLHSVLLRRGDQERYLMKRLSGRELAAMAGDMGECAVRLLSVLRQGEILSCEHGMILVKQASCLRSVGA
ncbi:hypothetical protein [Paenibacillus silviterrae]|uniref:hypothetical protein n=1 Tax=Paenibacillus silviterrae TaxID=3242194 RepID=UPI0025427365|nr:hypothetical protein [Paenibacillus chinjuensis]